MGRRIRFVILGMVVLVSVLAGYWLYLRNAGPRIAGISPKENPDGTIDYTLVDWSKEPPNYWVLRFPRGAKVLADENDSDNSGLVINGNVLRQRAQKNDRVAFFLRASDFKFLLPADEAYTKSSINVALSAIAYFLARKEGEVLNAHCSFLKNYALGVSEYTGDVGDSSTGGRPIMHREFPSLMDMAVPIHFTR